MLLEVLPELKENSLRRSEKPEVQKVTKRKLSPVYLANNSNLSCQIPYLLSIHTIKRS